MPEPRATLRLSPSSVIRAVVMLGLTVAALALVASSTRVIGWIAAAAVLAGLLEPLVEVLSRKVPRGLALAAVVLGSLGLAAGIGYAVVDDVAQQVDELEEALPDAARELEQSDRFGEVAREIELGDRAETFVRELPERLRGGEVDEALRAAATRGVAFLATAVLTIFFLIHGERLVRSAIRQLPAARQAAATRIALSTYRRTWRYISGSLLMAAMSGLIAYGCAVIADLPGKAPLALWIALWDLVPLLGIVLGALPMILLTATTSTWQATVAIAVLLLTWQAVEALRLQRRVEERSLHIGPFVTIAVGMVGLELYGIGGALVALVVTVLVAAVLDETFGHGPHSSAPEPRPEPLDGLGDARSTDAERFAPGSAVSSPE